MFTAKEEYQRACELDRLIWRLEQQRKQRDDPLEIRSIQKFQAILKKELKQNRFTKQAQRSWYDDSDPYIRGMWMLKYPRIESPYKRLYFVRHHCYGYRLACGMLDDISRFIAKKLYD